ncbi:hypothetical protein SNE40_000340 [Patella caerulea]|uniref:Laminin EGF-like protein n=1 Tax=Patella caerulea TaxID=87958 RepID=A0AAN8KED0_PATCE
MVDEDPTSVATWWQSITWPIATYDSTNSFEISIILSFNKLYRFANDMAIVFNSGRPRNMILEKSVDYGKTWTAIQYYARNCGNYLSIDGVASQITKDKLDQVICTTQYSGNVFNPQPGSQVKFPAFTDRLSLLLGTARTDYETYYNSIEQSDILNFLSFTDLRIRLIYPATDADETSRDAIKFLSYYYAISDIEITGRCFCNLHGSSCITENGQVKCVCEHFTDGRECEKCLPMYNNREWKAGTYSPYPSGTANECTKCECNDHAASCVYNGTVGRGVCIDCQHNTTGHQCEECVQGFFPNTTLPLNDTQRCTECSCEALGVTDANSSCIQTTNVLGQVPGQCKCKPLVTGRRCDECDPQYYGLLMEVDPGTCKMCNCDTDGTVGGSNVCGQADGQCPCKPSTDTRTCGVCKDGFYQFPRGMPAQSCLSCGCDPGGSVTKGCDKTSGKCVCKDHITGDKCTTIESNFYVPTVDDFRLEPEGGVASDCTVNDDLWTQEQPFDGTQFAKCPQEKNVTLNFASIVTAGKQMDVSWPYYVGVRYSVNTTESILAMLTVKATGASGATIETIRTLTGVTLPTADYTIPDNSSVEIPLNLTTGISTGVLVTGVTVDIDVRSTYTISLAIQGIQGSTSYINIDSAILVPALTKMNGSTVVASFRTYDESANMAATISLYKTCAGQMVSLQMREATLQETTCRALLQSVGAELNNATIVCGCDPTGTVVGTTCDVVGGQCQCKPGVGGRTCSRCLSGYYNLTIGGCKRCPVLPCPVFTTTSVEITMVTSTMATTAPLVSGSGADEYLGIFIGVGVGTLLIPLLIVICWCYTKRNKTIRINDNIVPAKNANSYDFNEQLATGKMKNKQKANKGFQLNPKDVRINPRTWVAYETEDSCDLDSIPEESSSVENEESASPYIAAHKANGQNAEPQPGKKAPKTVNIEADKLKNKLTNLQDSAKSPFNTFKANSPIRVPEMFADKLKTQAPDKPKRKNLSKDKNVSPMPSLRASRINPASNAMEYVYPEDYNGFTPPREASPVRPSRGAESGARPKTSTDNPSRRIDFFNREKDTNNPRQELLPRSNKTRQYADFGEFDEINGSMV